MARGEDTRNHSNRQVSRGAYARLARELSKGFPQMDDETNRLMNTRVVGPSTGQSNNDDAPAGGIPRPKMHSCGSCGEMTSAEHGVCADCR